MLSFIPSTERATEWTNRIERGLVRISTLTRLEVGYSARSAADHEALLWSSYTAWIRRDG